MNNRKRGFIALISVVIIAAVLLVIMTGAGMAGFFARFDSLGRENSEQARLLAESCVQIALLQLAGSSSYSPTNELFDLGTDDAGNNETCTIQGVIHDGAEVTISAYGAYNDSYQSVSATQD